jgi:predicted CXXCH cytochrome family protein
MSTSRIFFAVLLIAIATALVVGLCMVENASAAGPEQQQSSNCSTCHADVYKQWSTSNHAKAFTDDVFKSSWDAGKNQKYCLACHTTGYDPNTGNYADPSIGCQICHKPGPNGHPGGPMSVSDSAEFCGTCHTTTYHEWQKSGHGQANVACSSCHDMHSTSLKFKSAADLCASCHKDRNAAANMPMNTTSQCTDCHMYSLPDNSRVEGKAPTGHSFILGSEACQRCHAKDIHQTHKIDLTSAPQPGTDTSIMPTVAAPTASTEVSGASSAGPGLPGIAGGALGGLVLGFVTAAVIVRRKQ